MIWLNPQSVTLGSVALTDVNHVAVDRAASRLVIDHTDLGPHAGFVDVPEQRASVKLSREVRASEASPAKPGDQLTLSFRSSPSASGGAGRVVSASVVVTAVEHSFSPRGGLRQEISAIAVSSDGAADPITEIETSGVP